MTTKKPNEKNTKVEILQAYEELAKEKAALKSQLDQSLKEQPIASSNPNPEPKVAMNQSPSQKKMNYIIQTLEQIQLGFGSAVSELSEQLTSEASLLAELRQSVETEVKQLKELHNLEVTEETLDDLIVASGENDKAYQEEFAQQNETLTLLLLEQKNTWHKEQEEHQRLIKERNETLAKTRQRDTSTYKYDRELQRKLELDQYSQQQQALYQELDELQQATEKQWTEREKAITLLETQFNESKMKVEAIPKEREAALEGKGTAYYQAKIKSDLYAKEVEGQKRFYEQQLQSSAQTMQNQESRIDNLSQQLESALKQVQDLAVKAIEGSSNINSYQAIKEIALEQAKTQAKNK
jgi:hypothetical protein